MGAYISQPTGYRAFIPSELPPKPPLLLEGDLLMLLSDADRAIGRLDAATQLLPNPDLFVAMYVRREAVYSSQIEGTQASLTDLLEYEADAAAKGVTSDVAEVVNYVAALNHGLERLKTLPLSLRLINEIHTKLLEGVRGGALEPGEFRRSQNWIGPAGCNLNTASFVPPPPHEVMRLMGNLELFLHDNSPIPPLVRCALAHVQFEPFIPSSTAMVGWAACSLHSGSAGKVSSNDPCSTCPTTSNETARNTTTASKRSATQVRGNRGSASFSKVSAPSPPKPATLPEKSRRCASSTAPFSGNSPAGWRCWTACSLSQ